MVFFLGVMIMAGEQQVAIILGILLAIVLSSRERIRHLFKRINRDELTTTLKFAVIAFIVLPLLPDQKYSLSQLIHIPGTGEIFNMPFFNPYSIWFFVVLMSAISYI